MNGDVNGDGGVDLPCAIFSAGDETGIKI